MKTLELFKPLHPFTITQGFGQNLSPLYKKLEMLGHNGLDCIRGCVNGKCYEIDGANVRAAHDGEVVNAGIADSCEGYGVVLKTNEPFDYNGKPTYFKTIYWHLQKNGIKVRPGQKVLAGTILGAADNTGCSSGSHLHFGLKPIAQNELEWLWENTEQNNGYKGAVDPLPFMSKLSAYEVASSLKRAELMLSKILEAIAQLVKSFQK